MQPLVSTEWLAEHLGEPDLVLIDASWFMPASGRNGRDEYLAAHIPGARFLDIDELSDRSNPAPHMLPAAGDFGAAMERLGIGHDDRIVVYDNSPIRTAARGWFILRHFGAEQVAILDGGLQKWLAEGRPTESGEPEPREARFELAERREEIVTKQHILSGNHDPMLDARGKGRFEGSEPDPRPGVEPGHIPGARNLPFTALYNEDGTFKPVAELRKLFAGAGIDPAQPFVATCGSGVTANSLLFAAYLIGNDRTRLYDGSWSEWGADPATPKALGPAQSAPAFEGEGDRSAKLNGGGANRG
jgi:thiosulfate/3-mercaptopyruvate sulfurtransferase